MLDHLGLTVSDVARSQRFYTQALAPLGYAVRAEYAGRFVGFGDRERPTFWLGAGAAPKTGTHANYYGAFVLDPDDHNIEAVCHQPER